MRFADSPRALLTMIAYSLIGNTVLAVQPMVVGGLVDLLHFTQRQAGFIASAELAGFSAAGLAMLASVHRFNRRLLALTGVLLLVSADVLACAVQHFAPMLVLRCVAGIGCATAYAILPVLAAASSRPERVFGIVNATSIAYAGAFVWVAPHLLQAWQLPGVFLTMAVLALIVSGPILWVPREIHDGAGPRKTPGGDNSVSMSAEMATVDRQWRPFVADWLACYSVFAMWTQHASVSSACTPRRRNRAGVIACAAV